MKITLQSNDKFADFAEFDTETKALVVHSKSASPLGEGDFYGWFGTVGAITTLLFHVDHKLHFGYGSTTFSLEDDAQARIEGGEIRRKFTLERGGKTLITIDYEIAPPVVPPELDFTETHPEDFDFLLFVRNVLKSPERRRLARGFPRR